MFIRLQKGITLIEVLIAAGVLALIMGSTVALGRSVTRNQIITQDRAQALALTVEAAEIIRNLRDSTYVDQTQNRFNEFLASANCSNIKCDNLEISWDSTQNNWFIESNVTPVDPNLVEGDALPPNQETDNDPNGEVIVVKIGTGDVSDNTSRVTGTAGFKDAACSSSILGSIIYCRKVTLMPIVFDNTSDAIYDPTVDNKDSCVTDSFTGIVTCKPAVLSITEEDPAVTASDPNEYTFDAYVNSSFKIISEISWNEFGTLRSVESTDIITNWR